MRYKAVKYSRRSLQLEIMHINEQIEQLRNIERDDKDKAIAVLVNMREIKKEQIFKIEKENLAKRQEREKKRNGKIKR